MQIICRVRVPKVNYDNKIMKTIILVLLNFSEKVFNQNHFLDHV